MQISVHGTSHFLRITAKYFKTMANNDKLRQIISNIQVLKDLTNSMIDSEIYPVSFFSQTFDLIHKIQSDFHTLETDQVELFASQMKKHQALILSIHQQIRHIDTPPAKVAAPETVQPLVADPALPDTPPPVKKQPDAPPPQKPKPQIIEAPIKPPAEKRPPRPAPKEPSTITLPETPVEKIMRAPRPAAPEVAETNHAPELKTVNVPNGIPAEGSAPPSINDAMEKQKLSDLRKAFSLNDRFRYRRELFGGSEEVMNRVITALNNKVSYKESMLFLEEKLHWDFTNPTVKDFIKVLEIRFL